MDLITNEFAFSFAPEGWNYFRALVAEYEKNPNIAFENRTFFRFFPDERVIEIAHRFDVLFLHDPDKQSRTDGFKFYLGYYYDRFEGRATRDLYGYHRNMSNSIAVVGSITR